MREIITIWCEPLEVGTLRAQYVHYAVRTCCVSYVLKSARSEMPNDRLQWLRAKENNILKVEKSYIRHFRARTFAVEYPVSRNLLLIILHIWVHRPLVIP